MLDCGCGTAQVASFLALASARRTLVGVDGTPASLEVADEFRARAGIDNLHLVRADLFELPFAPASFRVVHCRGVVHHTADPLGATERVGAEQAKSLGMIGEVVPAASLMDRAREVAEVVCRWSPTALARTKQAIWESLDMGLEDALEATHKILDVHADHGDMIEGATAFMEKREPNWAPFDGKPVDIS